jgi:hypothetical protein
MAVRGQDSAPPEATRTRNPREIALEKNEVRDENRFGGEPPEDAPGNPTHVGQEHRVHPLPSAPLPPVDD